MKLNYPNRNSVDISDVAIKKAKKKADFIGSHLSLFLAIGVSKEDAEAKLSELWDSVHPKKSGE